MKKPRKSRRKAGMLPKGAVPLPTGGYLVTGKPLATPTGRTLRIASVRREPINYELLARALYDIAHEQRRRNLNDIDAA